MPNSKRSFIKKIAAEAICRHGLKHLNFRDLASAVELSPSTVHQYFRSKAELLKELIEDHHSYFGRQLGERVLLTCSIHEDIDALFQLFKAQSKDGRCLVATVSLDSNFQDPEIGELIKTFYSSIVQWLVIKFESVSAQNPKSFQHITPHQLASATLALLEGASLICAHGQSDIFASARQLLNTLLPADSTEQVQRAKTASLQHFKQKFNIPS